MSRREGGRTLVRDESRNWLDVWHEVPLVHQTTGMSCWAAAAAMLIGWRDSSPVDPELVARGADQWHAYRDGLLPKDVHELAHHWQLEVVDSPGDWTVANWVQMLRRHGPLWVGEASPGLHSIVVAGAYGDGSPDGTWMRINDPWPIGRGERYSTPFARFKSNFEVATSTVGKHAQILHVRGGRRGGRRYEFRAERSVRTFHHGLDPEAHSSGDHAMTNRFDDYETSSFGYGQQADVAAPARGSGWILSIDHSGIELVADEAQRRRFLEQTDWTRQHFPRSDQPAPESDALFRAMANAIPERRVPFMIDYRNVDSEVVAVPGQGSHKLYPEAAQSFERMATAAAGEGVNLRILSSWRSRERQRELARNNPNPNAVAQRVSAHNYGLAIDLALSVSGLSLRETSTQSMTNIVVMYRSPVYKWMAVHGASHGWYPYRREPWHWEYNPQGFEERFGSGSTATGQGYGAPFGLIQKAAAPDPAQPPYGYATGFAGPMDDGGDSYLSDDPEDGGVVTRDDELDELHHATVQTIPGLSLPTGFRIGAWIDVGGRNLSAHTSDHLTRMHALGINDACIMVNRIPNAGQGFSLNSVSERVLRTLQTQMRTAGIGMTLTSWLTPDKAFIDGMLAQLPDLARDLRVTAIEFDVEEAWTRRRPRGFANHTAAANYVWDALDSLREQGIEVGATTQVDVMTSANLRRVVQRAHFVVPQAYSTSGHAIGTPYGPQGLQNRALDRLRTARGVSGSVPMIMGLAAYGRGRWSGKSAREIMKLELERTLTLVPAGGIQGARYWSWKWIAGLNGTGGRPANSYAATFLGDLR